MFERLNSGGVELSGQETRNAVYDGPLNQLCLKLSTNDEFKKLWGFPKSVRNTEANENDDPARRRSSLGDRMFQKMEDVEMVLRFFAYRQLDNFPGGLNKIAEHLDKFLSEGNHFSSAVLASYEEMFVNSVSFISRVLGSDAFKVPGSRRESSKIAYDAIMYVVSLLNDADRAMLIERSAELKAALSSMFSKTDAFGGRKTNSTDVRERNRLVIEAFASTLNR